MYYLLEKSMTLTGSQLDRIHGTIKNAYNRSEMRRVLRVCMDLSFDEHAPDAGFDEQLWALIEWTGRRGRLKELVDCARKNNATNVQLAALGDEAQTWDWTFPSVTPAGGIAAASTGNTVSGSGAIAQGGGVAAGAGGVAVGGSVFGNIIIGGESPKSLDLANLKPKPGEPETLYVVVGGACRIGRDAGAGVPALETPAASVVLPPYRIGRFPVTNAEYQRFVRAKGRAVAVETGWVLAPIGQQPPPGKERHPVVGVTWDDAIAFCGWLKDQFGHNYRLPSEAEWEHAARGPDALLYPWGNKFDAGRCNAQPANIGGTTAAGEYSPGGDSPHHCADMAGNVWEWTNTLWGRDFNAAEFSYPYDASDGRENSTALAPYRELRICRGGSFADPPERVTCTYRARYAANSRNDRRGFRIVFSD
jgi:formylglycine-generating enzyme required for sulfatase activity